MTSFSATLVNQTQSTWTLVVYLTLPTSPTLASVAWKLTAPAASGGTQRVTWSDGFGVALATLNGTLYQQNLVQASDPGKAWKVVTVSNAVQFDADGNALLPTSLQVDNASGQTVNAGLAYGGTGAIYRSGLANGVNVQFGTTPLFWAILVDSIQHGELVRQGTADAAMFNSFVGPQAVQFPNGQPNLVATATQDGGGVQLALGYSANSGGA